MFDTRNQSGVGLPDYLSEGHAIPGERIAERRAQLDALSSMLMVLPSNASVGHTQTLAPRVLLHLLTAFSRTHDSITFSALPDISARIPEPKLEVTPERTPISDAATSARITDVGLLMLAFPVIVMIWISA